MDSIIMAIVLCQIRVQAVEYIFDDQIIKFEQISESDSFGNLQSKMAIRKGLCLVDSTFFAWLLYSNCHNFNAKWSVVCGQYFGYCMCNTSRHYSYGSGGQI